MSKDETDIIFKRMWNDNTTKWLIAEFKTYYELWKNGSIGKKNEMWQKIAEALNQRGLECSAGQAENRFKTLQRSYRKACGIVPSSRSARRYHHPYSEELSEIFVENLNLLQNNDDDDNDTIIIDGSNQNIDEDDDDDGVQQFLDESTGSIFTLTPQIVALPRKRPLKEEVKDIFTMIENRDEESDDSKIDNDEDTDESQIYTTTSRKRTHFLNHPNTRLSRNFSARIDKIINSNEQILNKASSSNNRRTRSPRLKVTVPRKKPVVAKSSVDVLLEMKELIKKIEIRRQARHEQNVKIAKERNAILRRKNKLLENFLSRQE